MERKGELSGLLPELSGACPKYFRAGLKYFILCLLDVCGCTAVGTDTRATVDIVLSAAQICTRSGEPEDGTIKDANIFIFSGGDFLEKSVFVKGDRYSTTLVEGREYSIYVCANFGYPLTISKRSDVDELLFHLAHPEDFSAGMPLCGFVERAKVPGQVVIALERLCSKISLSIDRSQLNDDVKMTVNSLRIGNCPRSCRVFGQSRVEDEDGCFPVGFGLDYLECSNLNLDYGNGTSGEVSLYMLENMQGEFPGNPGSDSEKVLPDNHPGTKVCSYVELGVEYESTWSNTSGGLLKYRFYLGESFRDADIRRNCHYHITVTPRGSGISENSWRVDKSALVTETFFKMDPEGYLEADMGEVIHVRCSYSPEWASFYCSDEELEEDRQRGIYEYVKDEDGKGVRLTITGYGTGMVYMSAGEPVNRAGLLYIHVRGSETENQED